MKKNKMKKMIAIVLISLIGTTFTACKSDNKEEKTSSLPIKAYEVTPNNISETTVSDSSVSETEIITAER